MLNNFIEALSDIIFFNYSHDPSETVVDVDVSTLVESGEIIAEAEAEAFFVPGLSTLFSESSVIGIDGAFEGSAATEAQIVASFSLEAGETFSFDLFGDFVLEAKEIDNSHAEYSEAQLDVGFLLLDTSNLNNIQALDYLYIGAYLISSEQIGELEVNYSNNFTLNDYSPQIIDVDGDNEIDFIEKIINGTYESTFDQGINLTLLKVSQTDLQLFTLNEITGTSARDNLMGTEYNDIITGQKSADIITTGNGRDRIVYESFWDLGDRISDFDPNQDQLILTKLLESIGYEQDTPFDDGYLRLVEGRGGISLQLDPDGVDGHGIFRPYLFLENLSIESLDTVNNFVF